MKAFFLKKCSLYVLITAVLFCLFTSLCLAVSVPSQVDSLKASPGTTSVTLSWDKVKACDAYAVFFYSPTREKYTFIKNVKTTECKVSNLDEGEIYYFAVQGYNTDGDQKLYGKVSAYVKTTTKIKEPAKIKKPEADTIYPTKVKLTWSEVPDAKYAVYFYDASTKKYTHIANVSKESYTVTDLSPEETYQFAVRAYRKVGSKTVYGDYSAKLKVTTNPKPIELEDARKLFNTAIEVYMDWVYSCSYTASKGYITREFYGMMCKFAPVNHPSINSKSDLEKMLRKYFTKAVYENELYLYIEVGGKLYYYAEGGSGNPDKGTNYYTDSLKKVNAKKYKYTLYPTYYLKYDNDYNPKSYTFTIVRKDGRWLFDTEFYPCCAKIKA